jgi:Bacterial TniB protein
MARKAPEIDEIQPVDRVAPLRAFLGQESARVDAIMDPLRACYARTDRDDKIDAQILRLIRSALRKRYPKRPESDDNRKAGVGFVVVGGSGSGKTAALENLLVDHPAFPGYGIVGSGCTFVSVLVPSPSTLAQLGNETLIAMGYAPDKPLAENVAWNRVRKILKKMRVMFLHYDDVHNVLQQKDANPKELKKIQATFRNLMISRTWPVQLVLSGTEETLDMFKNDRQLKRRLKYVMFGDLVAADDAEWVGKAVEDFARQAGLKYVERPGKMLVERLIHAAAYQFGLVFELLLDAIEVALMAKRRTLGVDDFIEAYADRTSQPDELNIFESAGWQVIDPSIIFEKENQEKEPKAKKGGKKAEVRFDR